MKTSFTTKAAAALALMMVSSASMAAIANTRHNLGSTGNWNSNSATTEICVFCHTPHGADSAAAAPLWNRHLGTASSYNTYSSLGTSTLDAKQAPIGSVSLACLSCHDGTQAMNVMLNSPGSNTTGDVNNNVNRADTTVYGSFKEFTHMSTTTEMINLSTDLRNDHPVSIQYAGSVATGHAALDIDFNPALSSTTNGMTVWYVETGTAAATLTGANATAMDKTDMKLYTRTVTAAAPDANGTQTFAGTPEPFVECASCHDPHVEAKTFLRLGSNENSKTCLACHTK